MVATPQEVMSKQAADRLLSRSATLPMGSLSPKVVARALLQSGDTFATVLFLLLVDVYGDELDEQGRPAVFDWHPKTIKMQLEQDFGVQLPKENLDKIMAAIMIFTTNYFYKDVSRFIDLCNILAGDDFSPGVFDPADSAEILWGVSEAMMIYPPNDDPEDTEFSPEVRAYIREVLKEEGIADPPDVLRLGADPSATDHIRMNFSDDPEMFQAVWEVQRGKRDDLANVVREGLKDLATQLEILALQNGSTQGILQKLRQVAGLLPAEEEAPV